MGLYDVRITVTKETMSDGQFFACTTFKAVARYAGDADCIEDGQIMGESSMGDKGCNYLCYGSTLITLAIIVAYASLPHGDDNNYKAGNIIGLTIAGLMSVGGIYLYCKGKKLARQEVIDKATENAHKEITRRLRHAGILPPEAASEAAQGHTMLHLPEPGAPYGAYEALRAHALRPEPAANLSPFEQLRAHAARREATPSLSSPLIPKE